MTGLEQLAVVVAGFFAGVATSSIGVASLVSFPVLVALGVPPVVANASNTVGLVPAGLSGSFGYRRELRVAPSVTRAVVLLSGLGSVVGALLLLRLPADVFESLAPWLILFACLLVAVQPLVSRWSRERAGGEPRPDRVTMTPPLSAGSLACGVYGGYFGAGQGVMMIAVLAFGLDLEMKVISALRTVAILASNLVATVIFVVIAPLDWVVVLLIGIGSVFGGYVGSHIGRALPPAVFRTLVVLSGVAVAVLLLR